MNGKLGFYLMEPHSGVGLVERWQFDCYRIGLLTHLALFLEFGTVEKYAEAADDMAETIQECTTVHAVNRQSKKENQAPLESGDNPDLCYHILKGHLAVYNSVWGKSAGMYVWRGASG